ELLRGHGEEPDREGDRPPARPALPCHRRKDPPVNDVKSLLELALSDGIAPGQGHPANPAADLARGRRRLRRRRLAGLAGLTAAVLGGALVPLSLHFSGGVAASHPQATVSRAVSTARPSAPPSAPAR